MQARTNTNTAGHGERGWVAHGSRESLKGWDPEHWANVLSHMHTLMQLRAVWKRNTGVHIVNHLACRGKMTFFFLLFF